MLCLPRASPGYCSDFLPHNFPRLRHAGECAIRRGGGDRQQYLRSIRFANYALAHRNGRLPLEKLVRHYPFARIEDAFAASERGEVVKPVVVMLL